MDTLVVFDTNSLRMRLLFSESFCALQICFPCTHMSFRRISTREINASGQEGTAESHFQRLHRMAVGWPPLLWPRLIARPRWLLSAQSAPVSLVMRKHPSTTGGQASNTN